MAIYSNGAFVFPYTTPQYTTQQRDVFLDRLRPYGLPERLVPEYAGDRAIMGRAIQAVSPGARKDGMLIRPIKANNTVVIYGLVKEKKDVDSERLDHHQEAKVSWSLERDNGVQTHCDDPNHPLAHQIEQAYQGLRGTIAATDWTENITNYITGDCQGQTIRPAVFWVPPSGLDALTTLHDFLQEIGITLILCEVEAVAKPTIVQAAEESLATQLAAMEKEVAEFDETTRTKTLTDRLEQYADLRQRLQVYHECLGFGIAQAELFLKDLEAKVHEVMDLKTYGTAVNTIQGLAQQGPEAVAKALQQGTLQLDDANFRW